jgi:hypothetical protein
MINLENLQAEEAERLAYSEGYPGTARLFARIADLEAERNTLQLEIEDRDNLPVRYFIVDYDLDDGPDIVECDEWDFLKAEGRITYKRHTVRENGVDQICLTKGMDS